MTSLKDLSLTMVILREKRFETPTRQAPIKQDSNSGSCRVGVSKCFFGLSDLADPTLAAFILCGPLQFLVSHFSDGPFFLAGGLEDGWVILGDMNCFPRL